MRVCLPVTVGLKCSGCITAVGESHLHQEPHGHAADAVVLKWQHLPSCTAGPTKSIQVLKFCKGSTCKFMAKYRGFEGAHPCLSQASPVASSS